MQQWKWNRDNEKNEENLHYCVSVCVPTVLKPAFFCITFSYIGIPMWIEQRALGITDWHWYVNDEHPSLTWQEYLLL